MLLASSSPPLWWSPARCSSGRTTSSATRCTASSRRSRSTSRPRTARPSPAREFAAVRKYAGQQLTTGAQAKAYADHFIAVHLNEIGGGKTYAQLSAQAQANPADTKLAGTVQTMFRGETLRGLLLNAYAFDTMGMIAGIAAVAAYLAAAVLLVLGVLGPVAQPPGATHRGDPGRQPPAREFAAGHHLTAVRVPRGALLRQGASLLRPGPDRPQSPAAQEKGAGRPPRAVRLPAELPATPARTETMRGDGVAYLRVIGKQQAEGDLLAAYQAMDCPSACRPPTSRRTATPPASSGRTRSTPS